MTLAHALSNLSPLYNFKIYRGDKCIYASEGDKQRKYLSIIMNKYAGNEVDTDINVEYIFKIKGNKHHVAQDKYFSLNEVDKIRNTEYIFKVKGDKHDTNT